MKTILSKSFLSEYKRNKALDISRKGGLILSEKETLLRLMSSLRRLKNQSPAYRTILNRTGVELGKINNIGDFRNQVPVIDKNAFFKSFSNKEILGKNLANVKMVMASSGFSGNYAFGYVSQQSIDRVKFGVDLTLDYWFDISHKKTFLINCMPMGVHIDTSVALAETSVRSDTAIALLKHISPDFDQTIIVSDPHFLKKLAEEGNEQKIGWNDLKISFVTGQDWLPETLRTYIASITQLNLEQDNERGFYTTMGTTEIGLNVFHESKYTVRLRREVSKNTDLRKALNLNELNTTPLFYHYYPGRTYIENCLMGNQHELVFSVLDKNSIVPLMRYLTGDHGKVLTFAALHKILAINYPALLPDLHLPIGILEGRSNNIICYNGNSVRVESIKEGLYSNFDVAEKITGLLKIERDKNPISIVVQLKNGVSKSKDLEIAVMRAIQHYSPFEVYVKALEYHEFPEGLELSYERKLPTG